MAEISEFKSRMIKTTEVLSAQFAAVRAGRANAAVLDQIEVDYYGVPTPIKQIASIRGLRRRSFSFKPVMRTRFLTGASCQKSGRSPVLPPAGDGPEQSASSPTGPACRHFRGNLRFRTLWGAALLGAWAMSQFFRSVGARALVLSFCPGP